MDRKIELTLEEYNELLINNNAYQILLDVIYNSADLSYDKKSLRFDSTNVGLVLKLIDEIGYTNCLEVLKNGTDNDS